LQHLNEWIFSIIELIATFGINRTFTIINLIETFSIKDLFATVSINGHS